MAWRVSWTLTVSDGNAVKPMLRKLPPGSVAKLHSMLHAVEHAVQIGGSNPAAALNHPMKVKHRSCYSTIIRKSITFT